VKACVGALKEVPRSTPRSMGLTSSTKIIITSRCRRTDKGLVVPVVRDCDKLSVAAIEKTIAGLGQSARSGTLKIEEMQGGTSPSPMAASMAR